MDNDLKLLDVINDPDALDQFLDFSATSSAAQQNFEGATGEFYNFENGQILNSSTENSSDIHWSYAPSASVSDAFYDHSLGSSATQITNVPVPTLAPKCGAGSQVQNLPTGVLAINSTGNYSSPNVVQLQQNRNIPDQFSGATVTDNSLQRASSVNKVVTNFAVTGSASNNSIILPNNVGPALAGSGGQMLMNVQPQTVVQNGAVRIQYVQVRNPHQPTVAQQPTNSLNSVQLQQPGVQISHGLPGGINLQGARFLIQAGNQSVSGNRTGQQINLQQMQVSASNLVGTGLQQGNMLQQGTIVQQGTVLQQGNMLHQGAVLQHGAVLQQGTVLPSGTSLPQGARLQQARLPTGTLMGRTNTLPMTGQVVDSNLNLSSGGQVVLQRASGQNVVFQTLQSQQQHNIALPQQQTVSSQDGKLPDGLVVQIGGQIYRFEQTHQTTGGVAVPVKQGAIYPHSQGGEFGEGGGVAHDPVKMLQQNVQLQQLLIGNQMNVLQLLQQQQQRQQQTSGNSQDALQTGYAPSVSKNFVMVGQQFMGSQVATQTGNSGMMVVAPHQASGGVVVNSMEATGALSSHGSMAFRPAVTASVLRPTLEKTVTDPSSEAHTRILPTVRPGSMSSAATPLPQSGLQFIQPKPTPTSVSVLHGVTSGISNFGSGISSQPMNVLRPGNSASVQQLNLRLPSSVATVQSAAPSLPGNQQALKSGTLQGPQNVQPVIGSSQSLAPAGQSQTVTTVQLSADQQNLLTKIQSQMKILLDLQKRNPDQEKYLQMLIGGQQRIISQGVAQYLQQRKINNSAATSGATGSQVTVTRPVLNTGTPGEASAVCHANSGEILPTGGTSVTSALSSATSTSSARVQQSSSSGLQNSGAPVKAEDLFQAFPYLKEKLEAQLAKMPPEQRQWFAKNQSVVFAKLQHHHRLLQERDKLQQQQLQQPANHLASAQQISADAAAPPPDAGPTRVIRSLHLTRAQKFQLYLQKDQKRATHPESSKPFENFKDVIRGLVPFHVFQTREPPVKDVAAVEEAFEEKSRELLDRKDSMLRKYRHLLWEEAMRPQLTSEMVLLERAFHSDEKTLLLDEKRQAEEDPDSFVPRPVLKRLKLDDDIKKEDDECKDEDVTGTDDTKIDFESHDKDDFLKAVKTEDSSTHSSPSNRDSKSPPRDTSVRRSSSVECYKSLQIKLEKLDNTESDTSKRWQVTHDRSQHSLNLHISARNVSRTDNKNGEVNASKNRPVDNDNWFSSTDAIEVPTTSSAGLFPSFTEDDAAVASLLNTEQLTSCSFPTGDVGKVAPPCVVDAGLTERDQRFDLDDSVNTLGESMNESSEDALYTDQEEMSFDTGMIANEEEDDELMQGTIDSLMADLTQFNRDLSSTSWAGGETKSDMLNGSLRRTGNQSASSKYNSPLQASTSSIHEDSENSSLQHEIQCAINSIIRLQQPWSDNASGSSGRRESIPRTDDDESSLDAAVNSILL